MGESTSQLDFYRDADGRARLRGYLRSAAERYGIPELAHALALDESTLRNQLDYRKRLDKKDSFWKPNYDAFIHLWLADKRFRSDCLTVTDEQIEDVETLSPEDALRDMQALALAGEFGNAGRERVVALVRKVKKGSNR